MRFGVVCEGPNDNEALRLLVEAFLGQHIDWFDPSLICWCGQLQGEAYLPWKYVKTRAKECGIKKHGKFTGELQTGEKAHRLMKLAHECDAFEVVFYLRDSDGDSSRLSSLRQAIPQTTSSPPNLVGVAHHKIEAWALSCFVVRCEVEQAHLRLLRGELGFDPTERAAQLDATDDYAKKSAKRVLGVLCSDDPERRANCYSCVEDWDDAARRGAETGLGEFIRALRDRLYPQISGVDF